jgi:hypothetical protein
MSSRSSTGLWVSAKDRNRSKGERDEPSPDRVTGRVARGSQEAADQGATQQRDALNDDSRRLPTEEIEKHDGFENLVEDLRSRGVQLETFDEGHPRARNLDERGNT